MAETHSTETRPTRAFVIHPDLGDRRGQRRAPDLALEEAVGLARALPAIEVVGSTVAKLRNPSPGMLFSSGKLEELGEAIRAGKRESDVMPLDESVEIMEAMDARRCAVSWLCATMLGPSGIRGA